MKVDWLSLLDYRSYPTLEWQPDPGVNLLIGGNGAGKTNLLEAVSYLSTLRSFRGAPDLDLVAEGADAAVIRAGVVSGDRSRTVEMEIPVAGSRRVQIDKTRLARTTDLLGAIRVVSFLPEDLDLVKRGPAERRDLLDDLAVQLWPASHLDQREYERALRHRNAFLRTGDPDPVTLGVWDSRLAQAGGKVLARRARAIDLLGPLLAESYRSVAGGGDAGVTYRPSWTDGPFETLSAGDYAEKLAEALERAHREDYERRVTTVGPHRDEPGFSLDGADARTRASQGEQRTIALAVKLASHHAVADIISEMPVLLLDDVFSELDPDRAVELARSLPEDTQTLITSARPEDVPVRGRVWKVGEGRVE
ncbi:MAG TPA: DNA replication/repair protein RecF [Acidimicrobiia bacterium]